MSEIKPLHLERADQIAIVLYHGRRSQAATLFSAMRDLAQADQSYAEQFFRWIETGSTILLREATVRFGDYWQSLEFANTVDDLDSAYAEVLHYLHNKTND